MTDKERMGQLGASWELASPRAAESAPDPTEPPVPPEPPRAQGGPAGRWQPGTEGLAAPQADQSVLPVGNSPFTMPE